jgi:hypothetical protein
MEQHLLFAIVRDLRASGTFAIDRDNILLGNPFILNKGNIDRF